MAVNTAAIQQQALRRGAETEEERRRRLAVDAERQQRIADLRPTPMAPEELAAQQSSDEATALRMGQERYRKTGPRGKGLIGAGLAWGADKLFGDKKRDEYTEQALTGLTKAREAARLKSQRLNLDKARGVVSGQDFDVTQQEARFTQEEDMYGTRRTDIVADRGEARDYAEGAWKRVEFHDPANPARTLALQTNNRGEYRTFDGQPVDPAMLAQLTEKKPGAQGSSASAVKRGDVEFKRALTERVNQGKLESILLNPLLMDATGLDPTAIVSGVFPQIMGEKGPEIQAMRMQLANISLVAVAPALEAVGPRPTDEDLKIAFKGSPGVDKEPRAWINYYDVDLIPRVKAWGMKALKEGTSPFNSEAELDMHIAAMREVVKKANALHYPPTWSQYKADLEKEAAALRAKAGN